MFNNLFMKVCIALPTRNEEKSVQHMIDSIRKVGLSNIIVIDGFSTDKTVELAKEKRVPVYIRDLDGKGSGVKKAIEVAKSKKFDVLVLIDCDSTYPSEEIPNLLKYIPEHDMVVGARSFKAVKIFHRIPNMIHTKLVNTLFHGNLTDINSGLRAFKISSFGDNMKSIGFDIEAEISSKALKRHLKIKEMPIVYKKRVGKSKIKIKDGLIILLRILKEAF